METRGRRITALWLIGGLVLVFLGQAYLGGGRYPWDGVLLYGLGTLCWVVALRRADRGPRRTISRFGALLQTATSHPRRAALMGLAVMLTVGAGWRAARPTPPTDFTGLLLAWAVGLLLLLAALAPLPPHDGLLRLARRARTNWIELTALAVLLVAALLARTVHLETIPANLGGDEGTQLLDAIQLLGPPLGNPFSTGWYSVPTMSFLAYGLAMKLFGFTIAGGRALSALIGTATVLATFLLGRELAGRQAGWAAGVLVAFGHYGLHFSRLASNQIGDGLFGALALYFLVRGLRDERGSSAPLWFGLAGVTLGLSWYGYFGSRLALVVVALLLIWRTLAEPRFLARRGQHIALLLLGGLLAFAPLAFHYLAHPESFASRFNQVNIFSDGGWLDQAIAFTGRSAASLLLEQFWKSISAFHLTPDPTFWYYPGRPLLDPIAGVFLVLGLAAATVRARRPGQGLLVLWFWCAVLMAWFMTENPPSSQRGVGTVPPVGILAGLGLAETVGLAQRLMTRWSEARRRLYGALVVALVLTVITAANLTFYFGVYTPQRVYGNPTAELSDVLCDAIEARESVPPIYFDGAPYIYWDFGAIAFRLRNVDGRDYAPGAEIAADLSRGALFVVVADNEADLTLLRTAFPGGTSAAYYSPVDGRLLFVIYEVPPRRSG